MIVLKTWRLGFRRHVYERISNRPRFLLLETKVKQTINCLFHRRDQSHLAPERHNALPHSFTAFWSFRRLFLTNLAGIGPEIQAICSCVTPVSESDFEEYARFVSPS